MDQNDQKVENPNDFIEGEITVADSTPEGADTIISLTNLIQSYIGTIERNEQELREHRQMLTDAFSNDLTYRELDDKAKKASKDKNTHKAQILKQPALLELSTKVKEMTESLKEAKETLSSYLQDYARLTGAKEFEDANGELREIVYVAKLVKAKR